MNETTETPILIETEQDMIDFFKYLEIDVTISTPTT